MHSFLSTSQATSVPGFNHGRLRLLQPFLSPYFLAAWAPVRAESCYKVTQARRLGAQRDRPGRASNPPAPDKHCLEMFGGPGSKRGPGVHHQKLFPGSAALPPTPVTPYLCPSQRLCAHLGGVSCTGCDDFTFFVRH